MDANEIENLKQDGLVQTTTTDILTRKIGVNVGEPFNQRLIVAVVFRDVPKAVSGVSALLIGSQDLPEEYSTDRNFAPEWFHSPPSSSVKWETID
ncbi:hypothetical protein AC1031_019423 [Aphanomyces cochlioides]|nr:hypothetical protein AC1031_019423 [Aphanomyces cochlioides]